MRRTSRANRGRRWIAAGVGTVAAIALAPLVWVTPAYAAPGSGLVAGTPCVSSARACVALGSKGFDGKAWLIEDGHVLKGPVPVSTGGPGEDTPVGTFSVLSKDADHYSSETTDDAGQPSAMPYSVFFTKSGVAFHGGGWQSDRTAGCVRLGKGDDEYFFDHLDVGDTVQVAGGAARYPDSAPDDDHGDDKGDHGGHGGGGHGRGGLFGL